MLDSDFWKDLGKEFDSVEDCNRVQAMWTNVPGSAHLENWSFEEWLPVSARLRFEALARRAGGKLNPHCTDALAAWLSALKREGRRDLVFSDPASGLIQCVCAVSADYCRVLESQALETERNTKQNISASEDKNITTPVDEWSLPGLTDDLQKRIKAQILKADAAYWNSSFKEDLYADLKAMQVAIDGICGIFFNADMFTPELVENGIPSLVFTCSAIGHWGIYATNSTWAEFHLQHPLVFRSNTSHWLAEMLDKESSRETASAQLVLSTVPSQCTRSGDVDAFLAKCNALSKVTIYRRHIWQSVGHRWSRQFEYWQSCNEKETTEADRRNFGRILTDAPEKFIENLKRLKLIPKE